LWVCESQLALREAACGGAGAGQGGGMNTMLRTVTVAELRRRRETGEATAIFDVRSPGEFAGGHLAGAENTPLGSPEWARAVAAHAEAAGTIFVICQSGGRSQWGGEALVAAGCGGTVSVEGGVGAWVAAGFPLERAAGGRGVIALERQVRIAAGGLVVTGCALGYGVHAGFFGLAAFVGAGLLFAGVTDFCGMGLLLARAPWNRG
jgi:rhodanese-related sulfurtransferase